MLFCMLEVNQFNEPYYRLKDTHDVCLFYVVFRTVYEKNRDVVSSNLVVLFVDGYY